MIGTVTQSVNNTGSALDEQALGTPLKAVADRMSSCALVTAGLVIKAGGGVLAKTGASTSYYLANGHYVSIASGTDMPALTGLTISAGKYNAVVFYIDMTGTTSVAWGQEGATAAAVVFPQTPPGKAIVGFLMITYASAFTGNSTALDTATTVYISPVGSFDPSIVL